MLSFTLHNIKTNKPYKSTIINTSIPVLTLIDYDDRLWDFIKQGHLRAFKYDESRFLSRINITIGNKRSN